ncbi:kinase-like domain-containing protein [Rhizophagus clarus]|uniref:Kinase-like domain-containing protein n=1 Tax=Rhizophagus clarus TaxID=94130 RepID=A0A8H3QM26_9GLOM|nr:kinase-like domain-containing protein [Rhizophagus clarus]
MSITEIKRAIENNFITYYDNGEFKNKREIENSKSSFRKIFKANWNDNDTPFIVKSLDVKKFINELKMQKEVDFHVNILRIYGVSKLDNQYALILEYADSGSLYSYLKENFTKLEWDDKYCLALQLANAIECIHNEGIVHCNLHAQNVLIHKNTIKVADFGLSKRVNEVSNYPNKLLDFLPYLDPKNLNNIELESRFYIANFKSDIYSIGVLFWLLSSGRKPFYDKDTQYDISLAIDIVNGKREEIINGTPVEYSDIYTACWSDDPDERPSIQIVISCLQSIIDHSIESLINEIEKESLNNDFEYMMDDLSSYDISSNLMTDDDFTSNFTENNLLLDLTDLTDNVETIVDKLIDHLIRMHDELSYIPIDTKEIIDQNIQNLNKPLQNKISDWLIKNQISSKYIFFRGFLYYSGIIVKKNEDKAFGLFSKASKDNYSIAQIYLGKCYENGNGIEKDDSKAFEWYEKAAKNGNKIAQYNLGCFYEKGKGIRKDKNKAIEWYERSAKQDYSYAQFSLGYLYENGGKIDQDLEKAIYWYKKASKNGDKRAQYKLGYFYKKGKGMQKRDVNKAIEWYERSAKQEYSHAQYTLGYLYEQGKKIGQDLEKAIYSYEKAAKNGNKIAQYKLGLIYEKGEGTQKDINKAIQWYERSAKQEYNYAQCSLGCLYEDGEEVDQDLEKAIYWYKKAAINGSKIAQLHLGYFYEKGKGLQKDIDKAIEWYEKSAEQECSSAQCNLGYLYENGEGIDQDLEKAIYWYKRAAKNGHKAAHYYLGKFYQYGIGIEKDEAKAFEHYKVSSKKGYLGGIYMCGYCYENGIGTDIDKEKAIYLYEVAAENGNGDAQKRLELQSFYNGSENDRIELRDFLNPIYYSIILLYIIIKFFELILYVLNYNN